MIVTYKVICEGNIDCGGEYIVKASDDYIEPEKCIWCGGPVDVEEVSMEDEE
ncbi:hypothetical protein OCE50_28410 [Bacillus wiedmannii]|nr:hypothetical protein [Bacillus wiedmannii]